MFMSLLIVEDCLQLVYLRVLLLDEYAPIRGRS